MMFLPSGDDEQGKKSVLRSIRVSSRLAANLEKEARERGISINSLVTSVLERHDEWGWMAEKFGFVHIPGELFQHLLDSIDQKDIAKIARESGRNVSTDLITFWSKEVTLNSMLRYVLMLSQYQKLFTLESTELHGKLVMIVHHRFGEKGSTWFLNFLCESIRANLNVTPTATQTKNSVRIEIPLDEMEAAEAALNGGSRRMPTIPR